MNFNEKLMNLRKKEGLSQEELAEKLNVTRQTISKWELGQTSPDMDKFSEIAKIFQVSVDELLSEKEINASKAEPIKNDDEQKTSKRNGTIVVILIIVLVCALVTGGYLIFAKIFSSAFGIKKQEQEIFNDFMDIAKDAMSLAKEELDNNGNIFNEVAEQIKENNIKKEEMENKFIDEDNKTEEFINQANNEIENSTSEELINQINNKIMNSGNDKKRDNHNGNFENLYTGSINGFFVKDAINKVITINQTEDKKISVIYNNINTQDSKELAKISAKFQDNIKYLLTYDYDEDGYICTMNISDI